MRDHRPELEGEEAFPAVTDDLPEIEDVTPVIEFDTQSENQKDRHEHYETEQSEYNVYQAFYNRVEQRRFMNYIGSQGAHSECAAALVTGSQAFFSRSRYSRGYLFHLDTPLSTNFPSCLSVPKTDIL